MKHISCQKRVFIIIALTTILLLSFYKINTLLFPKIFSLNSANYNKILQIKLALINYFEENKTFPYCSPTNTSAIKYSWRVFLLPFLDEERLYHQILSKEIFGAEANISATLPTCFRGHNVSDSTAYSSFLMVPSKQQTGFPVVINVEYADFCWMECKDDLLSTLINQSSSSQHLYELRNEKIVLCNNKKGTVLILAPDGEIYFLSAMTTVDIFRKIIDHEKFIMLAKEKHGDLTYFSAVPVMACPCPPTVRETKNADSDAETGGKMNGEPDERPAEKDEAPE